MHVRPLPQKREGADLYRLQEDVKKRMKPNFDDDNSTMGGAMVSWLVRWTPDRAVRIRSRAESWSRHSASLHLDV